MQEAELVAMQARAAKLIALYVMAQESQTSTEDNLWHASQTWHAWQTDCL